MIRRSKLAAVAGVALVGLIVAAMAVIVHHTFLGPKKITAFFPTATAVYPGDDVRVAGVKVGSIADIEPDGTQAKMTLHVARDVPIPADAKAVVVAQNLVAARYVQLTPSYRSNGPKMRDGAVIPADRTAVPVEWDEVKTQLMRLATDLGPNGKVSKPAVGRFIDSAADALEGNGDKLRQTLSQLSGVGRILAEGSGNVVDIIENLQTFVTALRDSQTQIVQFQNRFATLTSVLNESRSDLDAALSDLSVAVGEVQRFVKGTRDKTSEQIVRLADVTQNLVDHRMDVENILHVIPNAFANFYNIFNPDSGSPDGVFVMDLFATPVETICDMISSIENVTATESGKLCAMYIGPGIRLIPFNYIPIPNNFFLTKAADPENVIYTDPALIPCHQNWYKNCEGDINGSIPRPPETPPTGSAYTGMPGDDIPNWPPRAFWQVPPPPPPHPASLPPESPVAGPPPPGPPPAGLTTVPDILLPRELVPPGGPPS